MIPWDRLSGCFIDVYPCGCGYWVMGVWKRGLCGWSGRRISGFAVDNEIWDAVLIVGTSLYLMDICWSVWKDN